MISKESNCELNAVNPHKIAYAILIRGVAMPGTKAPYDVMPNDFNNWGNRLATAGAGHPAGVPPGNAWPVYDDGMARPEIRPSGAGEPKAPARRRRFETHPSRACYKAEQAAKVAGSISAKRGLTSTILTAANSA